MKLTDQEAKKSDAISLQNSRTLLHLYAQLAGQQGAVFRWLVTKVLI